MKMLMIGGTLALVLTAGTLPVSAQDAKAADVLAKTRKAVGDGKLETLKTLTIEADVQRNVGEMQLSGDVEVAIELPDKYVRSETPSGGMAPGPINTGFNGNSAILPSGATSMGPGGTMMFRIGPGGSAPDANAPKPTAEQQQEMSRTAVRSQRAEISRLMLGWFAMTHPSLQAQYTYAGEADSPDGKAHVIEVKDGEGFAARLFIDQASFLPLMVTYQGRQPRVVTAGGPALRRAPDRATPEEPTPEDLARQVAQQPMVEFSLFFENWRAVDGIRFPHVIRRAAAGATNEEWTIRKVNVNPKIDPNTFAVDAR